MLYLVKAVVQLVIYEYQNQQVLYLKFLKFSTFLNMNKDYVKKLFVGLL